MKDKMKLTYFGEKQGTIIKFDAPDILSHNLKAIKDGTRLQITIGEEDKSVTNDQHNFLCGVVYKTMINKGHFNDIEATDTFFKKEYRKRYKIPEEDKLSKTDLSRAEYAHYIDFCIFKAAKEGVYIPYLPPFREKS